jgi:hypothetical protein
MKNENSKTNEERRFENEGRMKVRKRINEGKSGATAEAGDRQAAYDAK